MSLNHLVGGTEPPLNLESNNMKVKGVLSVDGEIETDVFQNQDYSPIIAIISDGTGDSIASTVQASAIRIREETIVTYRCTFNSGTGASKVTLRFLPPVWTTITTGIQNLTCVANCTHERDNGAWESLINQGVSIESAPLSFALQLGREDNANFPVNKLFQLSARFSYTTEE
jgi:hypothetical protein